MHRLTGVFLPGTLKNWLKRTGRMERNPTWIAVVAVALDDGRGRWLMYKRPAGKHHAGLWEFPGGKVESEEIPLLALAREIGEELGIALDPASLEPSVFADGAQAADGREIVILLYTCREWSGEPQALEGGELGWFTPDEIAGLPKPPLDRKLARGLFPGGKVRGLPSG